MNLDLSALCPFGVEKLVKDEVKGWGFNVVNSGPGRVDFQAPWEAVYRVNLGSRTAERVLIRLVKAPAQDFDQLFEAVRSVPWEDWLTPAVTLHIEKVRLYQSKLTSVPAVQSMVQKAVFETLCRRFRLERLPQKGPEVALRVNLAKDQVEVFLDTTGAALHNRGYRQATGDAPLKENLAAALVLFSGWRRKYPLVDPFCGSGTILTEALLFAYDLPPGLKRSFAFEHLRPFVSDDWLYLRDEARQKADLSHRVRLFGSDKDPVVLRAARKNLQALGLADSLRLEVQPMETNSARFWGLDEPGFLITNPPYGERLETVATARNLARAMAAWETTFPGWSVGVLTPSETLPSDMGREPFIVRDLSNGPLRVKFYQFNKK